MHSCSEFVPGVSLQEMVQIRNVTVTETQVLWDLWLMVKTFAPASLLQIFMCPTSVSHAPQLIPRGTFESIQDVGGGTPHRGHQFITVHSNHLHTSWRES